MSEVNLKRVKKSILKLCEINLNSERYVRHNRVKDIQPIIFRDLIDVLIQLINEYVKFSERI